MKRLICVLFLFVIFLAKSHSENRLALIIGNSEYPEAKLDNPIHDAEDVASKLNNLGFNVIKVTNCSLREMTESISDAAEDASNYDVILFYYAGHGIQTKGENFLIPVDAKLRTEADVKYSCTSLNYLLDKLDESGCPMKIIVLDACRNNPFTRSWHRGVPNSGLATVNPPKGTFITFSTAAGEVALDGTGRNSPYTTAFLKSLDSPNLTLFDFFNEVGRNVLAATNNKQDPWANHSTMGGRFVFNEKKNNVTEIKYVSRPHNTIEAQLPTAINGRSIRSLYVSTAPTTLGYGKNKMNELEDRYSQAEQLSKQGKFEEAFKLYLETADAGHPDAMGTVGWYYKKGQGVARNEGLWIQYTDWAIQSKEYWRAYQLGKDLLERDYYEDAFFYLEIAYNNLEKTNGYFEETAYLLGECYQYGYGVEINLAKAIECYRESVKRSFGSAEYSDAGKALKKLNVPFTDVSPSDFVDATPRMVNGKSPKELYNMGKDSEEGRGFELKNLVKAYAYFKASAERCYGLALVKMGDIYAGKDGYPFQDSKLSKDYYERGITQLIKESDDDGYICCELYHIYNRGHGTTKDVEKAEFYAKKGTTLDYIYCYRYYAEILEGKGKLEEAFQNMRIAAEKGDGMAQYSVALMYLNGVGTISDKEKGIAMLLKAAKNHYASAHDAQWKLREYGINVDTEF